MYLNIFSLSVQIVFLYQDPTYQFLHTEESYVGFQNQIFLYETTLMPLEIFVPLFVCSCEQHNMVRYCMYVQSHLIYRQRTPFGDHKSPQFYSNLSSYVASSINAIELHFHRINIQQQHTK